MKYFKDFTTHLRSQEIYLLNFLQVVTPTGISCLHPIPSNLTQRGFPHVIRASQRKTAESPSLGSGSSSSYRLDIANDRGFGLGPTKGGMYPSSVKQLQNNFIKKIK